MNKDLLKRTEQAYLKQPPIDYARFFSDFNYALSCRLQLFAGHYAEPSNSNSRTQIISALFAEQVKCGITQSSVVLLMSALEHCMYYGMAKFALFSANIEILQERLLKENLSGLTQSALLAYAIRLHWGFYVSESKGNAYAALAQNLRAAAFERYFDKASGGFKSEQTALPSAAADAMALFGKCAADKESELVLRVKDSLNKVPVWAKYFAYFGLYYIGGGYENEIAADLNQALSSSKNDGLAELLLIMSTLLNTEKSDEHAVLKWRDGSNYDYDIIVQGGQSNANGTGDGPVDDAFIPGGDVYYLPESGTETALYVFADPEGYRKTNPIFNPETIIDAGVATEPPRGDFSLAFARRYIKDGRLKNGRKLLIIRTAVGGTGFFDRRWRIGDDLQMRMMLYVRTALAANPKNRLVAFLWHQGERDAVDYTPEKEYIRHFTALLDGLRSEFNVLKLPFVVGDFVPEWKRINKASNPHIEVISGALKKLADMHGGGFVQTQGLISNNELLKNNDTIHFCRAALYELGERYYEQYTKLV